MSSRVVSFQRFLIERERARRRRVAEAQPLLEWVGSGPPRMPSGRQLAHRKRMLDHLRRRDREVVS